MPLTGRLPLAQRLASSVERIVFDAERQHMLTVVAIFELVMALGIAEVWTADNSRSDGSQQRALPRARGGIKESAVMPAAWSSRVKESFVKTPRWVGFRRDGPHTTPGTRSPQSAAS